MAVYHLKMLEKNERRIESSWYLVCTLLLGNKTVITWFFGEKSKPLPLGASDDPMDYCPRPSASGNSPSWSSSSPRGNSFDYSPKNHVITV